MHLRSLASLVLSLNLLACGTLGSRTQARDAHAPLPWVGAVYPVGDDGEVRIDRYDGVVTLVRGGQIYASTASADMPGQIVGVVAAMALAEEGPTLLRFGQLGFGSGMEVAVELRGGARAVDVFERYGHVVAAAESIASTTGLTYQEGERRPVHPALRLVPPEQAVEEQFLRYDVVLSPAATSAMADLRTLIIVERLENLVALLSSGGIMVQHLPAADMQPETFQRLLRTFANVFPYMMVIGASPRSTDLFMIGSSNPLLFRPEHLYAISETPGLADLLRNAGLTHPFDIAARVLFASREEVMTFVQGAQPNTVRDPIAADAIEPLPALPAPDAPEAEHQRWQEAVDEHRQRFQRLELLRQQMYGLDWTAGQVCPDGPSEPGCLLTDVTHDEQGADVLAELSLSLMAAGRFVEAQLTLETAAGLGQSQVLSRAQQVLTLLLDAPPDLDERLPETLVDVRTAIVEGRCGDALGAVEQVIGGDAERSPDDCLVAAYALVHCRGEDPEAMDQVATLVQPLADDAAFAQRYPEVLYMVGRAAMVQGQYQRATWSMVDYVSRSAPPQHDETQPPAAPPSTPSPDAHDS